MEGDKLHEKLQTLLENIEGVKDVVEGVKKDVVEGVKDVVKDVVEQAFQKTNAKIAAHMQLTNDAEHKKFPSTLLLLPETFVAGSRAGDSIRQRLGDEFRRAKETLGLEEKYRLLVLCEGRGVRRCCRCAPRWFGPG